MDNIRTRFAPSPTGFMHLGSVRTALFAWLIAKQNNGKFILRIEDTDRNRLVEGSVEHIILTLKTLGINFDEGPGIETKYGPYFQSERLDIYHKFAKQLVSKNRAYSDPYDQDELNKFKEITKNNKQPFLFRNFRPKSFSDWSIGTPLRFLSNPKPYTWHDEVMGKLSAGAEAVDDFILIKSDGFPTYNFAHIVDDFLMEISHVIRSQEFIASTPNYLNLYEALEIKHPILATLPPVMSEGGTKKLSKRDGAKDVLNYIDEGYLAESIINILASLGFNDGTTKELFSVDELIKTFDLKRVQRSGAVFDEKRLQWMNGHYIRQINSEDLLVKFDKFWPEEANKFDNTYKIKILSALKDRLKFGQELTELSIFFFKELPVDLNLISEHKQLSKYSNVSMVTLLTKTKAALEKNDFTLDNLQNDLNQLLIDNSEKPVTLFSLIRIALTETKSSPGLAETLYILSKEESLKRIDSLIQALA